jgi:hypothetical protein
MIKTGMRPRSKPNDKGHEQPGGKDGKRKDLLINKNIILIKIYFN